MQVISKNEKNAVKKILLAIENGAVLVLPTDTVYGLVCDASNQKSVGKIFQIKNRDKNKPLPVFVKDIKMAEELALIDEKQKKIIKKSWPGAVTFVLKLKPQTKKSKIAVKLLTKNRTIALRIPDYDLVQEIFKKFKKPLAQTSANISGKGSTTEIKDILEQFCDADVVILDAGDLPSNNPSKIVDLTDGEEKVLRY